MLQALVSFFLFDVESVATTSDHHSNLLGTGLEYIAKTKHSCRSYTINGEKTKLDKTRNVTGSCAGTRCTDEECCLESDGSSKYVGCLECCGIDKTTACSGTDGSTAFINIYLIQFRELVNWGSLACIAGVLPALAGSRKLLHIFFKTLPNIALLNIFFCVSSGKN
jgi:hypothetical protein